MLAATRRLLRMIPLALASVVTPLEAADFAGLVDVGGGRKMYLECAGRGVSHSRVHIGQG